MKTHLPIYHIAEFENLPS